MGRPAELRSPSAHVAQRRKGTCSLWLKRNWLLVALFALALASAGMSVKLFIVPCDEKTSYETTNTTSIVNITSYYNETVLENVTVTETVLQLENVTTYQNISYDVTYNHTYLVNVTKEVTTQQPVDVIIALDASHSVGDSSWAAENQAGRELLRGLRDSLTGDLRAGVAVWANDGAVRQTLTEVDEATVDAMADFARLPYCGAVPGPYSPKAEQYSQAFCEGDPPGVQDVDHAYDLRHAVAALARDAETEWASGVAAVYDGDDWQESVADFVLGLLFCRTCRSSAEPAEGMRRRSTIDKLLTRAKHLRKKKHVGGPLSPLRTASPKNNEEPRRRSAPLLARDADTDWSSGVAAVYDGDDWQESVADFVINLVCCRFCRKAPKEEVVKTAIV